MADLSTIARPYAKAVFELANSSGQLDNWSSMLNTLANVAADADMQSFIASPKVTDAQVAEVVAGVAGSAMNDAGSNLVKLLAENGRVNALPDIAAQFELLKIDAENSVDVEVTTVEPMSDEHKATLSQSLQRKLGRDVRMSYSIDASLLGGALIKAGDLIIDGTVRGRLEQMTGVLAD
ncbi:MAG: F0F1 ATP synthase subunit delta [Gammaproteobacteria bacterium]